MNEQLLRSIIRLYAIVAGADGLLEEEKIRIQQFMSHHLSGRSVAFFLELLERSVKQVENQRDNFKWQQNELQNICALVNKELKLAQKFYLFLEMVELSALDGNISKGEAIILESLPSLLNLNQTDVEALTNFALAKAESDFDFNGILLISMAVKSQGSASTVWGISGISGLVAVLKLPSVETYFVRYLGERETLLNGQLMQNGMSLVWASGATIRQEGIDPIFFTDIRERFSTPIDKPQISFEATNISYRFPNGKTGLHNLSIAEKGGRIVAIMGASGSGKSTLFNVLNGNEKPTEGKVLINGKDIHQHPIELEGVIGYVHQDDLLNEHLTVFQNLYFAAKFSFGNLLENQIIDSVEKTLRSLGLIEVKDIIVGSSLQKTISGGQRKRLNIGMELIRQPYILFVDEPTSGLSSRDSMRTMELLKDLALNGKLVFVIIHQPSSDIFKMFDKLLVLDQGGYVVYYGNTLQSVNYFKAEANLPNQPELGGIIAPEEIFEIIESKVVNEMGEEMEERKITPHDWYEIFQRKSLASIVEKTESPVPHFFNKPNFFHQIWLYFKRDFLTKIHDIQYLIINLLEAPALALALALIVRYSPSSGDEKQSYLFFNNINIPAYFFMSVIIALFMGLSISAEEILKDRLLLKREKFLHLSRDSYLIAKILLLFGLSALHTVAFVAISDYVLEVNDIGKEFWFVMFSSACCANLMGLVLSDTFKTAVTVYFLIPLLLIPQLVLGGVVVKFDKLNPFFGNPGKVPIVGEIMISRWAYEAIMVAQFKNNEFQKLIFDQEQRKSSSEYKRFYLNSLQGIMDVLYNCPKGKEKSPEIERQRKLLKKELQNEERLLNLGKNELEALNGPLPIPKKVYDKVSERISALRHVFNLNIQKEERNIDRIHATKNFKHPFLQSFSDLHNVSENDQVNQIVKNKGAFEFIEETPDGFIQKFEPIYKMPEINHSFDFRAHFYSPFKHFCGRIFPTEYFNIAVIWLMSLLTLIVLRFRLLRWLIRGGK